MYIKPFDYVPFFNVCEQYNEKTCLSKVKINPKLLRNFNIKSYSPFNMKDQIMQNQSDHFSIKIHRKYF